MIVLVNSRLYGFLSCCVSLRALFSSVFFYYLILCKHSYSFLSTRPLVTFLLTAFKYTTCSVVQGPLSSQLRISSKIDLLSKELNLWMTSNRLTLNSTKTQLIWFGTLQPKM